MWWRNGRAASARMGSTTGLGLDAAFLDAHRRVAVVFRVNIALSLTGAVTLMGATAAAIVFGFLGRDVWATALGGVALLDLIGAAVYKPLDQINRILTEIERVDMLMVAARERLKVVENAPAADRAVMVKQIWSDILTDLKELRQG